MLSTTILTSRAPSVAWPLPISARLPMLMPSLLPLMGLTFRGASCESSTRKSSKQERRRESRGKRLFVGCVQCSWKRSRPTSINSTRIMVLLSRLLSVLNGRFPRAQPTSSSRSILPQVYLPCPPLRIPSLSHQLRRHLPNPHLPRHPVYPRSLRPANWISTIPPLWKSILESSSSRMIGCETSWRFLELCLPNRGG